ncbi:MAG: gliding motility-associated C-terminal domain-containing protein, partial [Bacteroidota bacterium]|nr:gliding motility-associated C-terminal domain-containing protein [Bacteroidota bacterium]
DNKPIRRKVSIVTENKLGCHLHSYFWVTIYPVPRAKIRLNSEGGSPENVFLSSLSTNSTACQWLFPDGSSSQDCDSVLVKFYNNGFYKIQLRSSNQYGCWDTTSLVHETIIKGLFVPNAFQPSNSDPQVKTFKPVGIGLKSYWMGIYDTWGNPIWETTKLTDTQPAEGWNGSTVIGKKLPMDVYIWRIKAVFIDGTEWKGMKGRDGILRTEGTVTLIK